MKIPSHLPAPPDPPEGHLWAYRGKGWASTKRSPYAMIGEGDTEWFAVSHPMLTLGAIELHYLEAVPTLATTDPIEAECHV